MRRKAGTGKKKQLYPANGKILIWQRRKIPVYKRIWIENIAIKPYAKFKKGPQNLKRWPLSDGNLLRPHVKKTALIIFGGKFHATFVFPLSLYSQSNPIGMKSKR
jgi:hypothetical protein